MKIRISKKFVATSSIAVSIAIAAIFSFAHPARAQCTNPAGAGGDILCNSDHSVMQYCNNTDWVGMGGGTVDNLGDHTATQNLDMGSNKIINLTDPTAAQDAATKAYVDTQSGGGFTSVTDIGTFNSNLTATADGIVTFSANDTSPTDVCFIRGWVNGAAYAYERSVPANYDYVSITFPIQNGDTYQVEFSGSCGALIAKLASF